VLKNEYYSLKCIKMKIHCFFSEKQIFFLLYIEFVCTVYKDGRTLLVAASTSFEVLLHEYHLALCMCCEYYENFSLMWDARVLD
jgi:hypothetical protein